MHWWRDAGGWLLIYQDVEHTTHIWSFWWQWGENTRLVWFGRGNQPHLWSLSVVFLINFLNIKLLTKYRQNWGKINTKNKEIKWKNREKMMNVQMDMHMACACSTCPFAHSSSCSFRSNARRDINTWMFLCCTLCCFCHRVVSYLLWYF